MQRSEVSGAVRTLYGSLGVKGVIVSVRIGVALHTILTFTVNEMGSH
jgi:hypothetical protein